MRFRFVKDLVAFEGSGFGFSRDWWFSKDLVLVCQGSGGFSKGTGSGFSLDPDFFQQELDLKTVCQGRS